jgi:hypothetical protein
VGIKTEVRDLHLSIYPQEEALLKPFLAGFDVTWGRRRRAQNTELSVYFLKPHSHTQEAFGFEQELLLAKSPYPALEARTIQAAEQILHESPARGRVERLTFLLVSDMFDPGQWVQDYVSANQETRLIAAFSANELKRRGGDGWYVRNELAKQFFGRDLFDYRLPLEHDIYFFGREAEVLAYRDAVRRGENRGLFGLRKTGKTSLLFKVERVVRSENIANVIYVDCKSPAIRTLRWFELISHLTQQITDGDAGAPTAIGSPAVVADRFNQAVKKATAASRLVLIFDEIEYISPRHLDSHWKQDFISFWQTIWSCQSRHRGLSAILAGVNPTLTEVSEYEGVQNPLFGIVSAQYLKGLAPDDTKRMVRTLGKRMGMNFEYDAVDYLQARYGGHPLLIRIACSYVNAALTRAGIKKPATIIRPNLAADEAVRDSELCFYSEHVISELRRFYAEEFEMLEILACKQVSDFVELARDGTWVKHLKDYGLLSDRAGIPYITIPLIEQYVAGKAGGAYLVPPRFRSDWVERRVTNIIHDIRVLERRIELKKLPHLFGPNSFPEAEKLAGQTAVDDQQGFEHFINVMNRCLVESIERFGQHEGKPSYFWDLKGDYPALHFALDRIKVYRNNAMHLTLLPQVEDKLAAFLNEDLDGKKPSEVSEVWFVLQQRVLDALFAAIQIETARLN